MNSTRQLAQDSIRDTAILLFGRLKRGRVRDSQPWLDRAARGFAVDGYDARQGSYWLWILGEFANRGGDRSILTDNSGLIEECVGKIERAWNEPDSHWLWEEGPGVFFSNLALHYAALRSINNVYRSENAQMLCKLIREKTFASFMRGKHFVSREGSDEVGEDIFAAAVPFGLVSAGDLAMLEAIDRLKEENVRAETAALLSGYYSEIGSLARARTLRDRAIATWDEEKRQGQADSSAFLEWASGQLEMKSPGFVMEETESDERVERGIRFIHDPTGGESPYRFANNERYPRLVTVGDPVAFRTYSSPFQPGASVALEYVIGRAAPILIPMEAMQTDEGERYWEASIEPILQLEHVRYRFAARDSGEHETTSDWFGFDVFRWENIKRVKEVGGSKEGELTVRFEALSAGGGLIDPVLKLAVHDSGAIGFGLTMTHSENDEGYSDNASRTEAVSGEFRVGHASFRVTDGKMESGLLNDSGERVGRGFGTADIPFLQFLANQDGTISKLRLNFELSADERLYGMGERFARMEFRGCELDNYVFNQYKDQGYRTYMPVPVVYSSDGYGLFLQSCLYSVFRFGSTTIPELMQIEADVHPMHQKMDFSLFAGKPMELVGTFAALSGKPKLPPKWAFGPWMSSNNWDSEKEVDAQLDQTSKHAIPSTVMVLEQWSDESSFYIFNDAGYEGKSGESRFTYDDFTFPAWGRWPDPKQLVERIHDRNIRVLLWQAPVMKFMDGIAHEQRDKDEAFMVDKGYGVRKGDGSLYRIPNYEWFRGSLVPDFTNPEASEWWLGKRRYLLEDMNIDGFKTDGGECIYGSDLIFHDGRTGAEMRNEYPNVYVGAFQQYADRYVRGGAITFSRAGYTGAQSAPLHWAGDEKSTFEAFRATIIAGLSCGMSGIPFWGWDLGGFSGDIPTAELFVRSAAMAAFCPVMQYHAESKGQFNMDRTPWNIAERTGEPSVLTIYKRFADMRMNMLPYIYEQARISSETGFPMMRAMLLAYPDAARCRDLTMQYLFGECMLVAPVTEEGTTRVRVYFPEGQWLSLFEPETMEGGEWREVAAELSHIPVYLKENSVIPLNLGANGELADDVGNRTDRYERLCLMIFLTSELHYRFVDDLGYDVAISAAKHEDRIESDVEAKGNGPITLLFRGLSRDASSATWNGKALDRVDGIGELAAGRWLRRKGDEVVIVVPASSGKLAIGFGL